ncbi:MAG: ComEC/Rec2 family competence protein, partial [Aureliella sp.]
MGQAAESSGAEPRAQDQSTESEEPDETDQSIEQRRLPAQEGRPLQTDAGASGHITERLAGIVYYRPLLWLALAVIAGVKFQTFSGWLTNLTPIAWLCALSLALVIAVALHGRGLALVAGAVALFAALLLGSYCARLQVPATSDSLSSLATRKAEPIALRGLIASAAVWKPNPHHRSEDANSEAWQTQWDLRSTQLRDGGQWRTIDALCTLTVDGRIDDLLPGDRVEIMGSFRRISAPSNPGGFDFAEHFRREGKFVSLTAKSHAQVTRLDTTSHYRLLRWRAWLVMQVDRSLRRWIGPAHSPLAAALVFGQREQVDWEVQQTLMATGTLHMLAISGMHVEIVAASVLLLAGPLGWRPATLMILIVSVCGAYAILAGGNPPVLRAVIVVSAFALARAMGRPARLVNVLGLAALTLVLIRVANVDSVGVQLSFLAVGTIGLFAVDRSPLSQRRSPLRQLLEERLGPTQRWSRWWFRSLQQTWRLSLWVWLVTCPLVWFSFHIFAPIAVPLNVLIALPLMLALVSGLLTGLFGWLPALGWLTGGLCSASLRFIDWAIAIGQRVPLGHLWLPAPQVWWMACFYGLVAGWLLCFGQRHNRWLLCLLVVWIVVGVAPHTVGPRGWWGTAPDEALVNDLEQRAPMVANDHVSELRCTFVDVGHGTSVIIEMPNREVWLYDAGHMGSDDRSHQDIAAALWHLPTARIERLLISHADSDHYNATTGLLERFTVGTLTSTSQFFESSDRRVCELLELLPNSLVREEFHSGRRGRVGEVSYQILHPQAGKQAESDNASSLCLLLEFAGKRILLPGDLEGSGLLDLTELPPRPCHVLMAPHHGSLTLDPGELLTWCQPQWVIISGNHRATRAEVLQKYSVAESQLGITFRDGAVQVRIDSAGSLSVWHWSGQQCILGSGLIVVE